MVLEFGLNTRAEHREVVVIRTGFNLIKLEEIVRPSLKKCLFGIAYPGFHLVGRSVGRHFFFNIYYLHMDGNGKKKLKNLRIGKKN